MFSFGLSSVPSKHSSWWRRTEEVLETSWRHLHCNIFLSSKTSWRHLEDIIARRLANTSWRRHEDSWKTKVLRWRRLQDVLKTSWKTRNVCWVISKVFAANFEHVLFCWKRYSRKPTVFVILKYLAQQANTYSK